ncbi:MAG TPA: TM0106 family RecB-like putative nuclease [Caulobacteraceae bacterium]|nr:TM0106 family RecB-like putative nuclease [Caulobacteraceae bacterium]
MEQVGGELRLSATDLVGHLACAHLTELDVAAAGGALAPPHVDDPALEALWQRGLRHEADVLAHLEGGGREARRIAGVGLDQRAVAETLAAMRAGEHLIAQAAFRDGRWGGRADVLTRNEQESDLGGWSYEPTDAKLARETKAGAVLQLCLYADLLAAAQGRAPENVHVQAPWTGHVPRSYRLAEFAAYYRRARRGLEAALRERVGAYPDPVEHCDVCRWAPRCEARRRIDDHPSLIAGASAAQIKELRSLGATTMEAAARLRLPSGWKPGRGARQTYEKLVRQAQIQVRGREAKQTLYELLPVEASFGLCRLPEPSEGDIFLDLEGDPFVGEHGLEYLFGYVWREADGSEAGRADWALTRAEERRAFEGFIDFVMARLARWPELHVYHFAPYEPAALKRLMGRYATHEEEMDWLLRRESFVDLLAVVRRAFIASVESYSIKKLEPLFALERAEPLKAAGRAKARLEAALELQQPIEPAEKEAVERYNRDDCLSALRLRDWLEARRSELTNQGEAVPRPAPSQGEASENVTKWLARITPVIQGLVAGVPDDPAQRTDGEQGRWLAAHLIDWHRREDKSSWWEFYRLAGLDGEDLLDERAAVAGLTFVSEVAQVGRVRTPLHRYRFPPQECQMRAGDELRDIGGEKLGEVRAIDLDALTIDIKKSKASAAVHPKAVFAHKMIRKAELQEALLALASHIASQGWEGSDWRAARDLILCKTGAAGAAAQRPGEDPLEAACRLALDPAVSVIPIQGPPGSGKTWLGARLICRLVTEGRRVAICANSHKVIRKLIDETLQAALDSGLGCRCVQKTDKEDLGKPQEGLTVVGANERLFEALVDHPVAAGTAWLWARPEAHECVDVLVIDEAAQMSLANVLAASRCARKLVLLGDPQQLDQPVQGVHPEGCEVSALRHALGAHETIPAGKGLFLPITRRLHPAICRFTSELFYEGKLTAFCGLERQELRGAGRLSGAGLKFLPVRHEANQSESPEEAIAVRDLIEQVFEGRPTWISAEGQEKPLERDKDVLVIAPFNAQVFAIRRLLPEGVRVGTVDKFQGQEAPLVIYSLTSSSQADAPRGMEFLYSLNRLNVATSRARCVSVLVASPSVFDAKCRTVEQMRLANAFCRCLELAETI